MRAKKLRKKTLEIMLSKTEVAPSPEVLLEQYTIPATTAAQILWLAAYAHNDRAGKTVLDLGCGTGRLTIGASILGAKEAIGVDIDPTAIRTAVRNAIKTGVREKTSWIVSDIEAIKGRCDTVVQNPPFGVQKKGADRKFLRKALEIGKVTYTIHKSGESNRKFLTIFLEKLGGKITRTIPMKLAVPPTFNFHREKKHTVNVDLYRVEKG